MTTYLTHPDHGVHLAYTDEEIKKCEATGWKVVGNAPPSDLKVRPAVDMHDRPFSYDAVVKRKPGRPKK